MYIHSLYTIQYHKRAIWGEIISSIKTLRFKTVEYTSISFLFFIYPFSTNLLTSSSLQVELYSPHKTCGNEHVNISLFFFFTSLFFHWARYFYLSYLYQVEFFSHTTTVGPRPSIIYTAGSSLIYVRCMYSK